MSSLIPRTTTSDKSWVEILGMGYTIASISQETPMNEKLEYHACFSRTTILSSNSISILLTCPVISCSSIPLWYSVVVAVILSECMVLLVACHSFLQLPFQQNSISLTITPYSFPLALGIHRSKTKVLSSTLWSVWAVTFVQLNQATSQAFWISVMSELLKRDYFSVFQATTYFTQMSYGTAPVFTTSSIPASSSTIACALLHFLGQITQTPLYPLETVDYSFPASFYSTLSPPQHQLWVSLV